MKRRNCLGLGTAALALAATFGLAAPLHAQDSFPSKPVKIIVGYAPGGSSDVTARLISNRLSQELGQPVIVENKPGAGGNIGADAVARATPDGYTILLAAAQQIVVNPSLYKNMPLDPLKDLAPITQLQTDHNLMVVNPSVPAKNLKEFIAYAKSKPKEVTFSSPGAGSPAHLAGELLNQKAGLSMLHVPYKGSGAALNDLIAGHVTMAIDNMPALLPQVQAGKLRAIAVASTHRASAAPDIPTMEEAGLKGYVVGAWKGLMAPAGTPAPIIAKLHDAAVKVLADPEVRKRLVALGAEPVGDTPEQFAKTLREESKQWSALVKSTGTVLD
ncbi:MAG: tripartite tricarboxylate transporter substrate binding protein [Gammaproteobacteria bacterium]|nr:tripartite tricarboxylate transporter substrate binding protein [Gammaproteobacteria bacterium]MBU1441633.1 tripartite tricarboxylate transporter substrate binding protein [Gammaproteobacteria bacterium]MBU2287523.1 tripartite tricarboxylate transporter substrate binding protein [Gammaproteobacteria bacterium]